MVCLLIVLVICITWCIFIPALKSRADLWILVAISFSPCGPWYTAYMADILASSAWAVHMLLVALSRLICCSLVCKARRYASCPLASLCINYVSVDDVKLRRWGMLETSSGRRNCEVYLFCLWRSIWSALVTLHLPSVFRFLQYLSENILVRASVVCLTCN